MLSKALKPIGTTMYIWDGGWNETDTGAGIEAVTLGVSPTWANYASQQDVSYNYKNTRYQIHNGLDCSGYMGWVIYNTLETSNNQPGYVAKASSMAKELADKGLGNYTLANEVTDIQIALKIILISPHQIE